MLARMRTNKNNVGVGRVPTRNVGAGRVPTRNVGAGRVPARYVEWLLSGLFTVAIFCFWLMPYKGFLSYHEQFQLFLFTPDYFLERIALPGGFVDYVSEFLVQFYYVPLFGSIILALLFLGLQRHTWMLCRDYIQCTDDPCGRPTAIGTESQEPCRGGSRTRPLSASAFWLYPLSFIPVFALWFIMSDENLLPTFPLSITFALALTHVYHKLKRRLPRYVYLLISLTLGYWLIGPSIFILALYSIIRERRQLLIVLGILVVTLLPPLLSHLALPYELHRFFTGINYHRYPSYNLAAQHLVTVLFAFIPLVTGLIKSSVSHKKSLAISIILIIVIGVGGGILVFGSYNSTKSELIDYDYMVRSEQWSTLIKKAERKPPLTPMGVCCLNLALSQRGLLTERLFEFFQNGGDGLLPPFVRDMTSPVPTAEVYYRLGMVNTAHRYFFEAQECIPNQRKSGRFMKRLIDCEIVNGQYTVARKWLRLLSQSLFYSDWAEERLAMLDNEEEVEKNPTYSSLRQKRETKDYLFSDAEMDQMLGMLFTRDNSNRMAYEYLMCYVLLQKDLDKFMKYYSLGRLVGYKRIPTVFQQVLIGVSMQRNHDPKAIPYKVENRPLNNTLGFISLYVKDHNDPALDSAPYNTNAWNYLLRGGAIAKNTKNQEKEGIY